LGSVVFGLRGGISSTRGEANKFSPQAYLVEIRKALEGVDSVSNIEIEGEGNTYSIFGELDDEEENFFPIYSDVLLSFDIFMPTRLQQKYSLNRAIPGVETFHVKLMYDNADASCLYSLHCGWRENRSAKV
jgi:hypothetical protein